jgi:hypothetical protein
LAVTLNPIARLSEASKDNCYNIAKVAGRNSSEGQDSPEIDRDGSSRPYPATGKAETLDAVWQVFRVASGVRTASMQRLGF